MILVLHEVLCSVVDTAPQHLHLSIVDGGIARPVEPLLVDVATRYLCIAFLAVRMAQMGACLIVAVGLGVVGLHIVGKPNKILRLGARQAIFAHRLHHDGIAWERARTTCTCVRIDHPIEAVVERPEHITIGQQGGLNAIAAVPPECTCEKVIVELVLIDKHIVVGAVVLHQLKPPLCFYLWFRPFSLISGNLTRHEFFLCANSHRHDGTGQ